MTMKLDELKALVIERTEMSRIWIVEKWNRLHRRFEPVIGNVAATREGCRLLAWECHRYDRFNTYRTALYRRAEKTRRK